MKRLAFSFFIIFLLNQAILHSQQVNAKLLLYNVKADAGNGNIYMGKKTGVSISKGKAKDGVLLMDVDVLRVIASYKLTEYSRKDNHTTLKFFIIYHTRYKKAKEVKHVKVAYYHLNDKGQFAENERIYIKQYNTFIHLSYTGNLAE